MKLLLICLGNICRSPMAEGALRARLGSAGLQGQVQVDSAGTGPWHVGKPPDPRAIDCARRRGVDISALRGRQLSSSDFQAFDWLLCADEDNLRDVLRLAPERDRHRVTLLTEWAGVPGARGIPDPYRGDAAVFDEVWRLVDSAARRIADRLRAQRQCGIIDDAHD